MPACFFLGQTIGIDPCERFDERGLPVIDVTGGREDEMLHPDGFVRHAVNATTTSSSCSGKMVRKSSLNAPRAT